MAERVGVLAQIEKVQNSIAMIDMHKRTIEGTSLDISLLETIKVRMDVVSCGIAHSAFIVKVEV